MKKRNIIMDCDPGIDDILAMVYAFANDDQFHFLGITTTAGNQSIENVTNNALGITAFLGKKEIPVAKGVSAPLLRILETAPDIHGEKGLGTYVLPATDKVCVEEHGVEFLRKTIENAPGPVTLVPTGPLTNIALLFTMYPHVLGRIDEICLMGGALCGGNVTATGEFNIWADPEAAQIVFRSKVPIVMCGLDVTNQCGLSKASITKLVNSSGRVAKMCGEMAQFYIDCPVYRGGDIAAIHDAATFMYLAHPEIFEGKKLPVKVDCSEGRNRGMTVCDMRRMPENKEESSVTVLLKVNARLFEQYLLEAIDILDKRLS